MPAELLETLGFILGMGTILFFAIKRAHIKNFPIKGWKWFFYILGWLAGGLNLLFWAYQYVSYTYTDFEGNFFSERFHQRTFYFGIFAFLLIIAVILLILFIG